MFRFATVAVAAAIIAIPAFATGLQASQSVERMVVTEAEDGAVKVTLQPATEVVPGDKLVYSINYANDGNKAAEDIVLTMPVPGEVSYIENSATTQGVDVAFSADGGETFVKRDALTVRVNGKSREALAAEITHIRWTFTDELKPGTTGALTYKALLK